jgi:hypothetical protein
MGRGEVTDELLEDSLLWDRGAAPFELGDEWVVGRQPVPGRSQRVRGAKAAVDGQPIRRGIEVPRCYVVALPQPMVDRKPVPVEIAVVQ